MEPTSSLNRGERKKGSSLVTGSEVQSQASGASCFITTDSEKSLVSRQASQVEQIELRTYVFLDSLQPQLAAIWGRLVGVFYPYLEIHAFGWKFHQGWPFIESLILP